MHIRAIGLVAILLFGPVVGLAGAEEERAATLSNAEARRLLNSFSKAYRPKVVEARVEAIRVLGQHDHARVAVRLLKLLKSKRNDPAVQLALFEALAVQQSSKGKVMKKVAAWLLDEASETRKRFAGASPGVRVDPKTGDPDLTSEEGRLVLQTTKTRGLVLREALLCLRLLSPEPPRHADRLAVFLQHPHDPLVLETLAAFSQWKLDGVMPKLLELYRMYPTESTWDTSHLQAAAKATQGQARSAWMARFGHPDKRRIRPEVVQALRSCLEVLTGRAFESPEELASWLREPESRRSAA